MIDTWGSRAYPISKEQIVRKKLGHYINHIVEINKGSSLNILPKFDDNYFDWVYLDSGHGFELTLSELNILKNKVKSNGIICGHDYCRYTTDGRARMGVAEAVNQFCLNNDYEFIYLTFETHRHLSFGIRKIKS